MGSKISAFLSWLAGLEVLISQVVGVHFHLFCPKILGSQPNFLVFVRRVSSYDVDASIREFNMVANTTLNFGFSVMPLRKLGKNRKSETRINYFCTDKELYS